MDFCSQTSETGKFSSLFLPYTVLSFVVVLVLMFFFNILSIAS